MQFSDAKTWLVDAGKLKNGATLHFSRCGMPMDDVKAALKSQYPERRFYIVKHGDATYVGAGDRPCEWKYFDVIEQAVRG